MAPQDRGEHFLDRRLAVLARDGDERRGKGRAPLPGQITQSALGFLYHYDWQRKLALMATVDHRGARANVFCLREEGVTVEALAAQRDKEIARAQTAAVGRNAGEERIAAAQAT